MLFWWGSFGEINCPGVALFLVNSTRALFTVYQYRYPHPSADMGLRPPQVEKCCIRGVYLGPQGGGVLGACFAL
jgi:hypothetical protein